jgi:hypothetical protein
MSERMSERVSERVSEVLNPTLEEYKGYDLALSQSGTAFFPTPSVPGAASSVPPDDTMAAPSPNEKIAPA